MATKKTYSLIWVSLALTTLVAVGGCKRNTAEYGGKTERPVEAPTPTTQLDPNVPAAPTELPSASGS